MRTFAIAVLLVSLVQAASAQQDQVKNDPMVEPNSEKSAESEVLMMLDEFTKRLENAGFKEVMLFLIWSLLKRRTTLVSQSQ